MPIKYHPLVQKTKIELKRLDKIQDICWEEQNKYNGNFLPISVEPKLRKRALNFINNLILLLESKNHSIKFDMDRCHIEMHEQLTEFNLRQKYFRKRVKNSSCYTYNTFEKSDKLEFQIGSYARKSWIDKENKNLEEYLPAIFAKVEKESRYYAELRARQKIEKEEREIQRKIDEEKAKQKAIEREKFENLINNVQNYKLANEIRSYISALEDDLNDKDRVLINETGDYIQWAYSIANDLDPLKVCKNNNNK